MNIPASELNRLRMACNLDKAVSKHHAGSCAWCCHRRGEDITHVLAVARLDTEAQVAALYEARLEGDDAILALAKATIREVQAAVDELVREHSDEADKVDPIRGL